MQDDFGSNRSAGRINWGAVGGLAFSLTVSAGFWIGVAMLVQHFFRQN
jgi:hypothetical protein